jgi:hypothetical protein
VCGYRIIARGELLEAAEDKTERLRAAALDASSGHPSVLAIDG